MGSYLLGSIVETGGGGRSQAQQRRRIREQQRDSSLQPEQGLVGVLPPRPSQAGAMAGAFERWALVQASLLEPPRLAPGVH